MEKFDKSNIQRSMLIVKLDLLDVRREIGSASVPSSLLRKKLLFYQVFAIFAEKNFNNRVKIWDILAVMRFISCAMKIPQYVSPAFMSPMMDSVNILLSSLQKHLQKERSQEIVKSKRKEKIVNEQGYICRDQDPSFALVAEKKVKAVRFRK